MSTPKSRARWLRGALVGTCSAIATGGAHFAAGGHLPPGSTLILAGLVCAVVGAALGGITLNRRRVHLVAVIGGLIAAQALGHLTLLTTAGHHHGGLETTPVMVAAHLAAAVILGTAITVVEYLYVVSVSLLCWLRLFAAAAQRSTVRLRRAVTSDYFAPSELRRSGLGMRAPPCAARSAA